MIRALKPYLYVFWVFVFVVVLGKLVYSLLQSEINMVLLLETSS